MTTVGIALFGISVLYLGLACARSPGRHPFPAHGFAGLGVVALTAVLAALGVRLVMLYLTPLAWTGYILALDGAVFRARGRSLLANDRTALLWMAALSVPLWLVFEAYNLRLENWSYIGLPASPLLRSAGYLWSFATIWPAVLVTADFLLATRWSAPPAVQRPATAATPGPRALAAMVLGGAACLAVPLLAPPPAGAYLFGLVWIGFVLLLDPLNYRAGRPSLLGDFAAGRRERCWALLASGVVCGFFWEFWNYWATARWVYVFPIFQQAKIFEMPLPGYLGFPPFAAEIFVMYVYFAGLLRVPAYEIR